ncbi:MAG TPA: glycosyltransferase family 2 protein, partial [bacterium]|nr:glycosyltransferase family 2 protein [bacterium]
MDAPLISIALATCNGGAYLREQLDSLYAQTYRPIEVVVCDDHSDDDTAAILDDYSRRCGLVYSVNQYRLGMIRNFEKVLGRCTGEYIALADQDDIWMPHKLERLSRAIGDRSLVYSDAELIDERDAMIAPSLFAVSKARTDRTASFEYLVCNACVTGCTALFRADLLRRALPIPQCETYHDWWLSVVASRERGVVCVPEPLVRYRQHQDNYAGAYFKQPLLLRGAAHFTARSRAARREKNMFLCRRTKEYIDHHQRLGLTDGDINFLVDINRYAHSVLDMRLHLWTLLLGLRHRNVIFPNDPLLLQLAKAFGRM